jgi:hypothetical protein
MSKSWYVFIGGSNNNDDVLNYYKIPEGKHLCLCGHIICAIYADGIGPNPQSPLSSNIRQYIKQALITELIQPQIPYDAKKYVYLRH